MKGNILMTSQTPSYGNHNVEWAVDIFRPLLQELNVQNIGDVPTIIKTTDKRNFIIKGMGRCIIGIQRQVLADGQKGYCVFIHKKELNLFVLSIVIDESLFTSDRHDLRVQRKALAIHEFVHCVAIMLSLSLLGSGPNPLIESLKKILSERLTVTTSDDFNQLLKALGTLSETKDYKRLPLFNDKHFRTGFEDFPDDYADLYLNFLFSYELLREVVDSDKLKTFKSLIISKDSERLIDFLNGVISEITNTKALEMEFVVQRFLYFLPRLSEELLKT
ncbi:MAG: hypothetical protein HDR55_04910 [Treponema sp.]|nr:hypothetical protein [Treponema sp.]